MIGSNFFQTKPLQLKCQCRFHYKNTGASVLFIASRKIIKTEPASPQHRIKPAPAPSASHRPLRPKYPPILLSSDFYFYISSHF